MRYTAQRENRNEWARLDLWVFMSVQWHWMAAIVYIIIQTRMSNCKFWNFVHQFCFAFCSFSISQPLAKFIGTATKLSVQCTHALNTTADNVLYTFVCCSCLYCRQNKSENWRRITLTRISFVSIVLLSSLPANPFLNEKKIWIISFQRRSPNGFAYSMLQCSIHHYGTDMNWLV